MTAATRSNARRAIVDTLAADAACASPALAGEGITVVEYREIPGRRRFTMPRMPFQVVTMGGGVVISCHPTLFDRVRQLVRSVDRIQVFEPRNVAMLSSMLESHQHHLVGPFTSYACSESDLRPVLPPEGIRLELIASDQIATLQPTGRFPNALAPAPNEERPDVLAVGAWTGEDLIGCAGASADSDVLWQIGVDVDARYRGGGIGRALVHALTEAIFNAGKIPYYTVSVSNLSSASVAISLGFWPAWMQMYAVENQ